MIFTLLGAVSQSPCLVGPSRPRSAVHTSQLTVLPYSDTQEETHNIAQLFAI